MIVVCNRYTADGVQCNSHLTNYFQRSLDRSMIIFIRDGVNSRTCMGKLFPGTFDLALDYDNPQKSYFQTSMRQLITSTVGLAHDYDYPR